MGGESLSTAAVLSSTPTAARKGAAKLWDGAKYTALQSLSLLVLYTSVMSEEN